jgi:hypothetical protein
MYAAIFFISSCSAIMNSMTTKRYFIVFIVAGFLSIPTMLNAAAVISLDEHEKKLIARGGIVVREIETAGKKGRTFEAVGLVKARRNNVLKVVKDYKKYPEFMPNVSRIDIVEQRGNDTVLNYILALPMGNTKKYRLSLTESAAGNQSSILEWHMMKWPELKTEETISDTTGYWRIEEKSENVSLVLYHVYTDPGPIPFGLGWIVDVLTKKSVPDVLLQTKKRAEKLSIQ